MRMVTLHLTEKPQISILQERRPNLFLVRMASEVYIYAFGASDFPTLTVVKASNTGVSHDEGAADRPHSAISAAVDPDDAAQRSCA